MSDCDVRKSRGLDFFRQAPVLDFGTDISWHINSSSLKSETLCAWQEKNEAEIRKFVSAIVTILKS